MKSDSRIINCSTWLGLVLLLLSLFFTFPPAYCGSNFAHSPKTPKIIYLKGGCSAGKSTLIQAMRQRWKNLEIVDEDSMVHRTFPQAVAQRFPLEYATISNAVAEENLYRALRTRDLLFKTTATLQERLLAKVVLSEIQQELNQLHNFIWKEAVKESIRNEIVETIRTAIKQGKSVVVDSWYFTADQIQELFPETTTIRVLLYCPLSVAYDRLLRRNQEAFAQGNLDGKRDVNQVVSSFCLLYQISERPSQPIQEVDIDQLNQTFNTISLGLEEEAPQWQEPVFLFGELSRPQLQELQTEWMQPVVGHESAIFYISPKERQDLIIDNTVGDIQQTLDLLECMLHFEWNLTEILTEQNISKNKLQYEHLQCN